MTFKALRRPHDHGRITTTNAGRVRRHAASFRPAPSRTRLVGRWTLGDDGRLQFTWELASEPPRFRLITRKRGSHA